jgi:hypothetical protein
MQRNILITVVPVVIVSAFSCVTLLLLSTVQLNEFVKFAIVAVAVSIGGAVSLALILICHRYGVGRVKS